VNEEWTGIARRYWEEAGVAGQIELRLARLWTPPRPTRADPIRLGFIDADKQNYRDYYRKSWHDCGRMA